ncbi:MAG TPA: dTDP-4-dehydrorhamnose reductase [Thermodesulfobacteriota bacterium]|nr:dTDP-4-dehydrorhamnose reductase [Thermodesulfobacteriota bacterium]
MRILITGSTGQLGRELIQVLENDELLLLTHKDIDIRDPKLIQRIVELKPNIVIHTAANTDVDECERYPESAFQVNTLGTQHVILGTEKVGAKLIYISTDYVFNGEKRVPYVESDETSPINVYGQSKLMGENYVRASSIPWIIVRTSWVYGVGRKNFITNVLEWARDLPILKLVIDKTGSPTYAKDLALAINHLIRNEACGTYHAVGQGACTWLEYGQQILQILKIQKEIVPTAFNDLNRPAKRPCYSALSTDRLRQSGFEMRDWRVALEDFLSTNFLR